MARTIPEFARSLKFGCCKFLSRLMLALMTACGTRLDASHENRTKAILSMRLLGETDNSDQTTRLVAWLMTKGIKVKVEAVGGDGEGYEVWVKDEDLLDEAKVEFTEFQLNPSDPKYDEAIKRADAIAREETLQRKRMQKNIVKVQGGQVPKSSPLTVLLIALCGIVFLMTEFGESQNSVAYRALQFVSIAPPIPDDLRAKVLTDRDDLGLRLANIRKGELWRLATPAFIHYGVFHILFNMMWLYQFGRMIENRYGALNLGLLVLATAVISNFFQCTVPIGLGGIAPGLNDGYLLSGLGGMSGVVYGLFGFIWIRSKVDLNSGMFIAQGTVTILLVWLFFCMTPLSTELMGSNVANWAHGIGLLVGMAAGYWPALSK